MGVLVEECPFDRSGMECLLCVSKPRRARVRLAAAGIVAVWFGLVAVVSVVWL